jgi:hypothetical protein
MFWSQFSDHPQGSSFVLVLLLLFQPLSGMWLYVVYVYVCLVYLPM